jgi:hypothetical protein
LASRVDIPKILFVSTLVVTIFLLGFASYHFKVFPYEAIRTAIKSARLVRDEWGMLTSTEPSHHLHKSRYAGSGVVSYDPSKAAEGLVLIASFFDDGPQIRLVAEDGMVVRRWPIEVLELWPNFEHLQVEENIPRTNWNVLFNGVIAEPDGSILFVMKGLTKMDWCGNVSWQVPTLAHHAVEKTSEGTYWAPGQHHIRSDTRHPPIQAPYIMETMIEVSADGEVLREIPILDLLYENGLQSELFANNREFDPNPESDVIHLNDVEQIPSELVERFPQFGHGDVLLSLRQPNMLMVVNPDSREVKWFQVGPWIQQHDGDWQADGTITVFDNRFDGTQRGSLFGGSQIVAIDPSDGSTKVLYGGSAEHVLYTGTQGDHQILENGNILIAEGESGRVIEVTPTGEIAWEYINRYSDDKVFRVSDATKYPRSYFEDLDRTCPPD